MITVILVIHLLIAISMVALILLQRSEGGALGIGGGGGGAGGLMTGRAAGNLLTRGTGILAAAFMVTSMTLAILANGGAEPGSVLDAAPLGGVSGAPAASDPAASDGAALPSGAAEGGSMVPAAPSVPSAPLSE